MELNCEEVEIVLKEWIDGKRDLDNMLKYKQKFNDKEWFDSEVLCYVLREDVFERIDWATLHSIIDQICLSSAVNVQNALKRLMDFMKNSQSPKQCGWTIHEKLCQVIGEVLWKCKDRYESNDLSSQQVYAQIFHYLIKIIEQSEDQKTIECAWKALGPFPFHKFQYSLRKLVHFIENPINQNQLGWHLNMYDDVICQIEILNQENFDYLFSDLRQIMYCCEDISSSHGSAFLNFPLKQILSQVYQPLIQTYLQSSQLNWQMHRNLLKVLLKWLSLYTGIFKENTMNMWFEYLKTILHKHSHVKVVSLAIKLVEMLCLRGYFDVKSEDVLKSELIGRVQSLDCECPLAHSLHDEFDFDRYQVEWCARWCVHNLMDRHKRVGMGGELPLIKLSNDRLEARNDQNYNLYIPVRSQYSVTSGVYFYEATIATNGKMGVGWTTPNAVFDGSDLVMSRMLSCENSKDNIFVHLSYSDAGDVMGCLIDLDNRRFVFYCNGKEVVSVDGVGENENKKHEIHSISPYYATALLFRKKHYSFNFGQTPFKFPPNDIQFMNFHKASGNDARRYQLCVTSQTDEDFWFKHLPVDNQVDLFYRDQRQNECDELVKRVERDIAEGREVEEMKKELKYYREVEEIKKEFECTQYIQAIIEEMSKEKREDKVDVMAQWVWRVIEETIEGKNKMYQKIFKLRVKILQLLYPYLHLRINSTLDCTKHRNICVLLSNLIRFSKWYDYDFIKYIRKDVFTYLTRTLTETSDQWTQLFGLIALDHLELSEGENKMIQENKKFREILNKKGRLESENILSSNSSLSQQIHFLIEHLLTQVHSPPPSAPNPAALNSHDRTSHLKLSLDLFSARTDQTWQSVRSTGRVTKGIYYFEAVLLTNGPMRIGWSTKRTKIVRTEVGDDQFSVAFDGYSRAVWHNDEQMQLESSVERWKADDVIGCLIDLTTNRENNEKENHFSFFLNGHLLSYQAQCSIYCSPHPYHASISLSAHQQVFLNFGQAEFKHSPDEDYSTFFDYAQDATYQKSLINLNNNTNLVG